MNCPECGYQGRDMTLTVQLVNKGTLLSIHKYDVPELVADRLIVVDVAHLWLPASPEPEGERPRMPDLLPVCHCGMVMWFDTQNRWHCPKGCPPASPAAPAAAKEET